LQAKLGWLDVIGIFFLLIDGVGEMSFPNEIKDKDCKVVDGRNDGHKVAINAGELVGGVVPLIIAAVPMVDLMR
jgi:hypothetical protein